MRRILLPLIIVFASAVPDGLEGQAGAGSEQSPVALAVKGGASEASHAAGTTGHWGVFVLRNPNPDTTRCAVRCTGLGRVHCAGVKHIELALPPNGSVEVVAFYGVGAAGSGALVLTARSATGDARVSAKILVRVR